MNHPNHEIDRPAHLPSNADHGLANPQPVRLLIVDDQAFGRLALQHHLHANAMIEVLSLAASGIEALQQTKRLQPDVILMDFHMPDMDGLQATHKILQCCPQVNVMVVSGCSHRDLIIQALQIGAKGFLQKERVAQDLVTGIQFVSQGNVYLGMGESNSVFDTLEDAIASIPLDDDGRHPSHHQSSVKDIAPLQSTTSQLSSLLRPQVQIQITSPEHLDRLTPVIPPKTWLPLTLAGVLISLVGAWSIIGRIPVVVSGQGVLVHPGTVVDMQSPYSGQLSQVNIRVGDIVRPGDVLATLDQSELKQQLQQQQIKLAELNVAYAHENSLRIQTNTQQKASINAQKLSIQQQLQTTLGLSTKLKERFNRLQALETRGALAKEQVLDAEQAYYAEMDKIAQIKAQLQELEANLKNLNEKSFTQVQGRKEQIQAVQQIITSLEEQVGNREKVLSQHQGRILEVSVSPGQVIQPGGQLGTLMEQSKTSATHLSSIAFFSNGDGKQIREGMPVEITPTTLKRERFGGILGTVTEVGSYPITEAGVTRLVGNDHLARSFTQAGATIQISSRLLTNYSSESGFRWSASQGPPIAVTAGTTTTVRVTVEKRAPITFILPSLRSISGIE